MKLPRITKSIFWDQFIFMQSVGVLIGLFFPYFLAWYGFPEEDVLAWDFQLISQASGQAVGLISFLLISTVIRPHLKLLSQKMEVIANGLKNKDFLDENAQCSDEMCGIEVTSDDEIGTTAKAYNEMLHALIQAHEVEVVYNKFTKIMSENMELKSLSDDAMQLLIDSTNIEAAAVMVVKNAELSLVSSIGISSAGQLKRHDLIKKAVDNHKSFHITLPQNIELDGVLAKFHPTEIFVEPLEYKGVVSGVLVAATGGRSADDRTIQLVKLFSRSIGLAINNALIHERFQKLAAFDSLTNVYNRRFGMERLRESFSQVVREHASLSVAMLDIDHFKNVNDTYGHLVGDKVIVMASNTIKEALREGDVVIRYGGEEFLIVMHGASSEDALKVCERIRHRIKDSEVSDGSQKLHVTISCGIATYPEVNVDSEIDLINEADQALYVAKESGRDRSIVAKHKTHKS